MAIAGLCATCIYGFETSGRRFSDFGGYYTASRILTTTDSVSFVYNDDWFKAKMNSFGIPDSTFIMYVNPPPIALVMIPVSRLEPAMAKVAWNVFSVILAFIALELLRRLLQIRMDSTGLPVLVLLATCTLPFLRNLQRGQIYVLMLILLLLFVQGYMSRNPLLTSLPLAGLLLLKYFGWMFLILFAVERRWREFGTTMGIVIAGFLLGWLFLGAETYLSSFEVLRSAIVRSDFALTGLPAVPAFFGGLLTHHPLWNQNPIQDIPWLASLLTAISALVMMTLTLHKGPSPVVELRKIASLIVLSVIFTPLAADHHYMLIVLPLSVFIFSGDNPFADKRTLGLMLFIVVVVAGWYPQASMGQLMGWEKVIAFPRLYGAILLWFMLLPGTRATTASQ